MRETDKLLRNYLDADSIMAERCRFLRVENLPHDYSESELRGLFDRFGKLDNARLNGRRGFVSMSCTREASEAVKELASARVRGASISVHFDSSAVRELPPSSALPQRPTPGKGGGRDDGGKGGGAL